VSAQIDWAVGASDPNSPVPLRGHAMAFHEARGRAVVVAGLTDPFMGTPSTQFFEFDGVQWSAGSMPPGFAGRWRTAMAFDAVSQSLILFGGDDPTTGFLADTWSMSAAGVWTLLAPATVPPARVGHTMVFDSVRGVIVMFGGDGGAGGFLNDTWEWNGTNWTAGPAAPAGLLPRVQHASAFDRAFGVTIVAGGIGGGPPPLALADTWSFDGVAWTLQPATIPSGRANATMAFDRVRRRTVLFGGDPLGAGPTSDTFDLVGATLATAAWTQRFPVTTTPRHWARTRPGSRATSSWSVARPAASSPRTRCSWSRRPRRRSS
jgi:hypothetical protein